MLETSRFWQIGKGWTGSDWTKTAAAVCLRVVHIVLEHARGLAKPITQKSTILLCVAMLLETGPFLGKAMRRKQNDNTPCESDMQNDTLRGKKKDKRSVLPGRFLK